MTTRLNIALLYGALAIGAAGFAEYRPDHAATAHIFAATVEHAANGRPDPLAEIEPGRSGYAEDDDLPAYLTKGDFGGDDAYRD